MVAIDEKYIPRKAGNSGPQNPTVAWQGKQGYKFEQSLGVTGLQYVRQRWYDPNTRQFISQDPLGFGGGDVNLFRYAENNPINRNDPGGTALEYIGNNLYWKVHPAETAWNIAHELTDHGAWYRKIFQRPSGGFSHLHPGERLVVNPINEGLIANHHWIAEPGQPAGPMVYVGISQSPVNHIGEALQQRTHSSNANQFQVTGHRNKIRHYRHSTECVANAMKRFRQGLMNLMRQYNQEVGDFHLNNAIQHEIQVRNQVRTQLVVAGVGGIATASLTVAAEALDVALAASVADQRAIIGETVGAYKTGSATAEEVQAAVSANANVVGALNTARTLITPVRATLYGTALALTSYLAGGDAGLNSNALDAAISTLPQPFSSALDLAHAAAVDATLQSQMETNRLTTGSGRAFGFLAKGLNLLVFQFARTIKNCEECDH